MVSSDGEYSSTHGLSLNLLRLQADAIGIPIIQTRTSWQTHENEFKKTILSLKKVNINAGVFGDIDLQGHRDWVERVCREVTIKPILPLWEMKREEILLEFINSNFKALVCAVKASVLGKEWLGREINEEFIKDLKNLNVDICGENGE